MYIANITSGPNNMEIVKYFTEYGTVDTVTFKNNILFVPNSYKKEMFLMFNATDLNNI
jgi:hypothetical protein